MRLDYGQKMPYCITSSFTSYIDKRIKAWDKSYGDEYEELVYEARLWAENAVLYNLARAHSYPDNEGMFENNPRPRDDGKQTDIIKPRNIMKEMNKSETGAEALKYINDNNIPVTLLYNIDVKPSLMGEYDPVGKRILIYASNTKSAKETALTVIHEAAHARLGGAGTRKSEVICRLDEIKHNKRRNSLTLQDLRNTIKAVNKHKTYSKLPWR